MSERKFNIGDRIMCMETGVVGKCIKFYIPTAYEEQTMVMTDDGRRYHAPTSLWEKVLTISSENDVIAARNHLLKNVSIPMAFLQQFGG